ncbi:MAG: aminoglycoside 6-adenylyltransferase [Lachnospiraceae bacterium]|nr:aminoglycoside 6-adenylyltransferase [Lachnospiraceae bacterium]
MRTEQEMYDLILKVAREDERIRAVYIDGSRTNPDAPRDIFQDYDVVYVVHETESFINDRDWTQRMFGKILYMQRPDEFAELFPGEGIDIIKSYGWLMQFADGNRIDLHVETIPTAKEGIFNDTLRKILLDKDGILPEIPESNDAGYHVKKPTEKEYSCACNEFWWCLNNVAKGLWRNELTYVQDMVNHVVRKQLEKLLSWKVGLLTDWSEAVGKSGKYMYRWLPAEDWGQYLATWFSCNKEEAWEGSLLMCTLFDRIAKEVGAGLGYEYNQVEAENSFSYFKHVRTLSADAKGVY